jgi:hypothetical protein
MNHRSPRYQQLVRASAWYDLVVTAGFATPWTFVLLHGLLSTAGEKFGVPPLPPAAPMEILFANLMGSVVLIWAALRLTRPLPAHGLLDGIARALFTTWQAYALTQGVTPLLWFFLSAELAFAIAQLAPWLGGGAPPPPPPPPPPHTTPPPPPPPPPLCLPSSWPARPLAARPSSSPAQLLAGPAWFPDSAQR